jgi:uncharacterized membrane protein
MRKWIFPTLSAIAAVVVSIVTYERLPAEMAVHFGSSETPNDWMIKPMGAFLLPALIVFVSLMVWLGIKFEKDENKRRRIEATIGSVMAVVSATLLAVHIFIIAYNIGYELVAATVATIIVGIEFILIGNLLPRLPQGSKQWPKMSESVRRKVSRFQGRTMIILGFAFLLLSLLPSGFIFPIFFLLLTTFIVTLIGSTIHYTRIK